MGGRVVNATPRPLCPLERPVTHCIGGWVGLRAGQDGCGKSRPPLGFDPRTVQPVASRYTVYVIPAAKRNLTELKKKRKMATFAYSGKEVKYT